MISYWLSTDPWATVAVAALVHRENGKPVEGASGNYGPVYNPATGAQEKQVAFASVEEVDAAVRAAKEAFTTWGTSSLAKRTSVWF